MPDAAGGKAPHPLAINTGDQPAATTPPPGTPPPSSPPPASAPKPPKAATQPPAEPMDPHLMVELATVEQLLATRDARAARMELVTLGIAGLAFLVAIAAYRAATRAELMEADE